MGGTEPGGATEALAISPNKATNEKYRPELDGIRALCILFTVANHVPGQPYFINGGVGVDVFFGLSGWLITSLLIRERQEQGKVDLRAFYIRRFFRIIPLYASTVLGYVMLAYLDQVLSPPDISGKNALSEVHEALPYLLTMCAEYRSLGIGDVMGQAWTIGIEEKFYIFWPLMLFFFGQRRGILFLVAVAMVGTLFLAFGVNQFLLRGYCGLFFGSALATFIFATPARAEFLRRVPLASCAAAGMACAYIVLIIWPHPALQLAIGMFGTLLIASLWFDRDQTVARLLRLGALPWLGRLTYAIYLVQAICIKIGESALRIAHVKAEFWTLFVLGYLISIVAAWIARVVVERPMILYGKKLAHSGRAPGAAV
jgi:peptidoglycan/LPS O-acetylase OafA/YrhL